MCVCGLCYAHKIESLCFLEDPSCLDKVRSSLSRFRFWILPLDKFGMDEWKKSSKLGFQCLKINRRINCSWLSKTFPNPDERRRHLLVGRWKNATNIRFGWLIEGMWTFQLVILSCQGGTLYSACIELRLVHGILLETCSDIRSTYLNTLYLFTYCCMFFVRVGGVRWVHLRDVDWLILRKPDNKFTVFFFLVENLRQPQKKSQMLF